LSEAPISSALARCRPIRSLQPGEIAVAVHATIKVRIHLGQQAPALQSLWCATLQIGAHRIQIEPLARRQPIQISIQSRQLSSHFRTH
jgi:hypothetical protein